jgi:uncharacterized membrane protein
MIETISRKKQNIYLWFILALGTVLRLIRLGSQSFWYDEVYSANLSAKSLQAVIPRFGQTPTLYHILLHFWLFLGRSDTMIRLLSVLFGVVALWVIYLLGRNFLDARHGLLCSFLLAISPFHIWYSQEARMYTLLILLSMVSVFFFLKFLQGQRGWPTVWWVVTSGLAIYTHYYAAFILFFQVIFFSVFHKKYRSLWRRFCYVLGYTAVIVLPIFILFFFGGRYASICAEGAGGNPVQIFSIPYTFFTFSLGFSYGQSVVELHRLATLVTVWPYGMLILPATLLFSVIIVIGLRSLWREREKFILVLLYLLVPMLGACLISMLWPQFSYNVRYVSMAVPAYIIILARGLLAPRRRIFKYSLLVLVLILTLFSLYNHYCRDKYAKEDYRSAAQFVSVNSEEGDIVLAPHLMSFEYYYHGPVLARSIIWSPKFYRQMIHRRVRGFHRVWFVLSREWGVDPDGKMRDYMRDTFPTVIETTFANLYLGLFDLSATQKN